MLRNSNNLQHKLNFQYKENKFDKNNRLPEQFQYKIIQLYQLRSANDNGERSPNKSRGSPILLWIAPVYIIEISSFSLSISRKSSLRVSKKRGRMQVILRGEKRRYGPDPIVRGEFVLLRVNGISRLVFAEIYVRSERLDQREQKRIDFQRAPLIYRYSFFFCICHAWSVRNLVRAVRHKSAEYLFPRCKGYWLD